MLKINLNEGQNVWFFSDPHYGHKNICRGVSNWPKEDMSRFISATRDFNSIGQMNDAIVNNLNAVVDHDDILFCLGDWSFGGIENVTNFRNRVVCQNIHLTLGNHDHHIERNANGIASLFTSVSHYLEVEIGSNIFVMMHYPMASWNGVRRGWIHLHGHEHFSPQNRFTCSGKMMDVGVDGNNMQPYSLNDVLSIMKNRDLKTIYDNSHHVG